MQTMMFEYSMNISEKLSKCLMSHGVAIVETTIGCIKKEEVLCQNGPYSNSKQTFKREEASRSVLLANFMFLGQKQMQ